MDESDIELFEFYKIVLREYYKSKQKPSIQSKFEAFCEKFKSKMYEIQQDMKDLEEEDGGFDGRIESDSSEVDSLEAFAAMDEEPEDQNMASASDPQPAAGDPIDLDADIPQTHSEESQDSQEFGVDFKF